MKKCLFVISVLFGMLFSFNAQAQVRFGVTGGVLLNKVNFSGINANSDNYIGWYAGPTLELGFLGVKVDGSVLYTKNGVKFDDTKVDADYISIPVNLKFVLGSSKLASLYLGGGPQFDYIISDKDTEFNNITFKKNQLSFNVGGGVRLMNHLQIGAYYNIPTGNASEPELVFKNNMWKVNAVIFF